MGFRESGSLMIIVIIRTIIITIIGSWSEVPGMRLIAVRSSHPRAVGAWQGRSVSNLMAETRAGGGGGLLTG